MLPAPQGSARRLARTSSSARAFAAGGVAAAGFAGGGASREHAARNSRRNVGLRTILEFDAERARLHADCGSLPRVQLRLLRHALVDSTSERAFAELAAGRARQ